MTLLFFLFTIVDRILALEENELPRQNKFFEKHYYIEKMDTLEEIHDPKLQEKIEHHMQANHNLPFQDTAREAGFSSFAVKKEASKPIEINPSLLETRDQKSTAIISRLKSAPALPVSCLASAEHVIAMQNSVKDFVSEFKPKSKNRVMYEITVKEYLTGFSDVRRQISRLQQALLDHDAQLLKRDISIHADRSKRLYFIEISTQRGDIQKIIKGIKSLKPFKIINTHFDDIGLNEGLCLIKEDASNPIHALVDIANTGGDMKGFLERDAGLTSGLNTHTYQDNHWTFNFYSSLKDMQQRTGYTDKSYAVKLALK